MEDTNISDGDALANEVEINLNKLGKLMLNRVGGKVDRANIVAVDQGGSRQRLCSSRPRRICHVFGHGAVLHLSTQTGDDVLTL
jgi:hypothetical protein